MHDHYQKMQGIAHDINGLMAQAMLMAEPLFEHGDGFVAARATRISAAIDQVVEICQRELTPSSATETLTEFDHLDIERLLNHVANVVSIESTLSATPIEYFISVDADVQLITEGPRLFRILFNLVLNAANAVAQHGGSWIEVSVMQVSDRVYFDICDDGPGLPEHVLAFLYPNLGQPAAPRTGRIGTGLVTAASLASVLGGQLRLTKSTASGTAFCLSLDAEPWQLTKPADAGWPGNRPCADPSQ